MSVRTYRDRSVGALGVKQRGAPAASRRLGYRALVGLLTLGVASCVGVAAAAGAQLSVIPAGDPSGLGFDAHVSSLQAGGHPDATTGFTVTPPPSLADFFSLGGPLKDSVVDLPPGVIGNPQAVAKCTTDELRAGDQSETDCPAGAQVGIAIIVSQFNFMAAPELFSTVPVYAMQPSEDQLAVFAFKIAGGVATLEASVRPSDYGVRVRVRNVPQVAPVVGAKVTLWGIPADASHDPQRCHLLDTRSEPANGVCEPERGRFGELFGNPGQRRVPFFTNPTVCDGPKTTTIKVSSWYDPVGVFSDPVSAASPMPTGCEKLSFDPSMSVRPTSTRPDSPTGLSVDLTIPQNEAPNGLATAELRDVRVTLPEQMTISPSAADGLAGCSDEQLGIGSDGAVSCPAASKIGSVSAQSPVLAQPLSGSAYVGSQRSSDPESGEMFRMFLVLRLPNAQWVKLVGHVRADHITGRLTATFANNPQVPVERVSVNVSAGSRAALAMPAACGSQAVAARLSSWGGQVSDLRDSFQVDCAGVGGFAPAMTAGTDNAVAGEFSPLVVRVDRADRQEFLDGVSLDMPPGLLAKLKGVTLCGDADASAGTCPAASRVGIASVGAGPGPTPFFIRDGVASLTGPYKGAPYGLSVAVRAAAGPFDLGTVVVRQAIYVDPIDAHIRVVSDPLPTILSGVPVRLRTVAVRVDRPGFALNATSCAEQQIRATLHSQQGSQAVSTARYQAGECASLDLAPKLAISLTGKGQTTDGKHPGVHAVVSQTPGQANLKKVVVSLPLSLALDPDNAQALCEFTDGSKIDPTCPAASIVGHATARTPILNQPLTGPVYFVKNVRTDPKSGRQIRTLPKLVIPLTGENGLRLNLIGTSNVVDDHLVTTFDNIPDAPVSDFALDIAGGSHGILVVSGTDICKSTQIATRDVDGQNGKTADASLALTTPACPIKILSKKIGKTSVTIKVGGLRAGKLIVTGKGIKKTTKTITTATVATVVAHRTHGHLGTIKAKVTYRATSDSSQQPADTRETTR